MRISKWNGTAWVAQANGAIQNLTSVWGLAANNLWTVGYGGTILHKSQ